MSDNKNIWSTREQIKIAAGNYIIVERPLQYSSIIRPKYSTIVNESSFFGSDTLIAPDEIERRIIEGISKNHALLNDITKVFIYFNQNATKGGNNTGPIRYFLYAGKSQPVDIIADRNLNSAIEVLKAAKLDEEFSSRYIVNFSHNVSDNNLPPEYTFATRELTFSLSLRGFLKVKLGNRFPFLN